MIIKIAPVIHCKQKDLLHLYGYFDCFLKLPSSTIELFFTLISRHYDFVTIRRGVRFTDGIRVTFY